VKISQISQFVVEGLEQRASWPVTALISLSQFGEIVNMQTESQVTVKVHNV